jgi:hypothetical protein
MKSMRAIVLCCVILVFPAAGCRFIVGIPESGWNLLGSEGLSPPDIRSQGLALSSSGMPVVAWIGDAGPSGGRLAVRGWNGSSWAVMGANEFLCAQTYSTSLWNASDPVGNLFIAYRVLDTVNAEMIRTQRWNGTAWSALSDFDRADGDPLGIAYDGGSSSICLLAGYSDLSRKDFLRVFKQAATGGGWTQFGPDYALETVSAHIPFDTSLGVASDGSAWVSFTPMSAQPNLRVLALDGVNWNDVSPNPGLPSYRNGAPVVFASDGTPFIAFCWLSPATPPGRYWPRVLRYSAGSWVDAGTPPVSRNCGSPEIRLRLRNDSPVIVVDESFLTNTETEPTVFRLNGATWTVTGRHCFTQGDTLNTSFAISPDGTLYASVIDADNDGKVSVYSFTDF